MLVWHHDICSNEIFSNRVGVLVAVLIFFVLTMFVQSVCFEIMFQQGFSNNACSKIFVVTMYVQTIFVLTRFVLTVLVITMFVLAMFVVTMLVLEMFIVKML